MQSLYNSCHHAVCFKLLVCDCCKSAHFFLRDDGSDLPKSGGAAQKKAAGQEEKVNKTG